MKWYKEPVIIAGIITIAFQALIVTLIETGVLK